MKAKVVTDSGSGLSQKEAQEKGIGFLPLQIMADGKNYLDGVDMDAAILTEKLEDGVMPTTSQPRLADVEDFMEECEKDGITDIIQVTLSSGLSSTASQVQAAAKRHGINVYNIEPWSTLYVQKYLTLAAQKMLEDGKEPAEIQEFLQGVADRHNGYLIVEDLDHLANGGRLTPAAAKLGSLLKIKPIMNVGKKSEGKVDLHEKVRTFSKSIKKVVDQVSKEIEPGKDYIFYIGDGGDDKTKEEIELIKEKIGDEHVEFITDPIYPVILCHTGLGCSGIQYVEKIEGVPLR